MRWVEWLVGALVVAAIALVVVAVYVEIRYPCIEATEKPTCRWVYEYNPALKNTFPRYQCFHECLKREGVRE